jgi:hypothetical protein
MFKIDRYRLSRPAQQIYRLLAMRDPVPLNADDFRPVIGKHHSRERHRAKTGHFQDSNAFKCAGHLSKPRCQESGAVAPVIMGRL